MSWGKQRVAARQSGSWGKKTSHYTTQGGANTNKHYGNTYRGGNSDFHSGDRNLTSNEVFYGRSQPSARNRSWGKSAPAPRSRPSSAQSTVSGAVNRAISVGAPAYNMGDHQGCYDVYKMTAGSLMGRNDLSSKDQKALGDGFRTAQSTSWPSQKAWAMRTALDSVGGGGGGGNVRGSGGRSARGWSGSKTVKDVVNNAISMGAPTYNMGDSRGCYDIYESTAGSLMGRRDLNSSDRMALLGGLRSANMTSWPEKKAWAMRGALDNVGGGSGGGAGGMRSSTMPRKSWGRR